MTTTTRRPEPDWDHRPWTFAEWLEWAEWHAVRNLQRGHAFMIAASPNHPMRSRTLSGISGRYALSYELGHRVTRQLQEENQT